MASLDLNSVRKKIQKWEHSTNGQEKIQKRVNYYILNNVEKTQAGSKVLTRRKIIESADKLVELVRKSAQSSNLPASVAAHFDSLKRSRVKLQHDGSFSVEINFTDDLTRESLQPEKYDGVRNIIAIFNNGYPSDRGRSEAISYVTGYWHGKETVALAFRPGLYFLQDAVNDFNLNYGMPLGMYAELGAVYDSE